MSEQVIHLSKKQIVIAATLLCLASLNSVGRGQYLMPAIQAEITKVQAKANQSIAPQPSRWVDLFSSAPSIVQL